jgi:hypothetical protein
MRPAAFLGALLASCAQAPADLPEDPAALIRQLDDPDLFRREEAACRLSLLGLAIPDNSDTARIGEGLQRALGEGDPQRMIWRAYHVLRAGCLGRDWSRVAEALSGQGLRLIEIYEPHDRAKFVRFLAQPAAYVNGAGDRHDLFFWVQSVRKDGGWIVREVYVGLCATFDAPFKQLSAAERYPRGSVLAAFFGLEELQKLALVYPQLEEIELSYGRIRLKGAEAAPAGFHVNAGFVMDAKAGGRGVTYTAESGLDPREIRGGRLAWDGFTLSDTWGPLTLRGSSFWGGGALKPSED